MTVCFFNVAKANERNLKPLDVLIIYSTGTSFKTISDMNPQEVDAVTTATPEKENCKSIAEKLAAILSLKGLSVRVTEATKIKHRDEVLKAKLIIIGTPGRFGNVSWEIKKLLDEEFGRIYILSKGDRGPIGLKIAAFSMAEIENSAQEALEAINKAVRECKGELVHTITFLTKHSREEIDQRIMKFGNQISTLLQDKRF
jgi:flavodoxin